MKCAAAVEAAGTQSKEVLSIENKYHCQVFRNCSGIILLNRGRNYFSIPRHIPLGFVSSCLTSHAFGVRSQNNSILMSPKSVWSVTAFKEKYNDKTNVFKLTEKLQAFAT